MSRTRWRMAVLDESVDVAEIEPVVLNADVLA